MLQQSNPLTFHVLIKLATKRHFIKQLACTHEFYDSLCNSNMLYTRIFILIIHIAVIHEIMASLSQNKTFIIAIHAFFTIFPQEHTSGSHSLPWLRILLDWSLITTFLACKILQNSQPTLNHSKTLNIFFSFFLIFCSLVRKLL